MKETKEEGMKYCRNCGKEMKESEKFCKYCGCPVDPTIVNNSMIYQSNNYQTPNIPNYVGYSNEVNGGIVLLAFLIPIVGLVLALYEKEKRPQEASACLTAAIVAFVLYVALILVFVLLAVGS